MIHQRKLIGDFNKLQKDLHEFNGKAVFNTGKSGLNTYCPKCESKRYFKNKNGHLWISTQDPVFNCVKCEYGGIIATYLRDINFNVSLYFDSSIFNDVASWKYRKIDQYHTDMVELNIEFNSEPTNYKQKLEYIKNRLPVKSDIENIPNIIFDIKSFLLNNNIKLDYSDTFLKYLNENFIGFIGNYNSIVICRNIDVNNEFRYFKININPDFIYKDFYGIVDTNKDLNEIVMTEGIFNVLNVYNKKLPEFNDVNAWFACLNKTYRETLKSILFYLKTTYVNLHILSDNDVDTKYYKQFKYHPCVNNVRVYKNIYNETSDFGDQNLKIKEIIL